MVASVGFGKPTARSFLASTTNRCAASKVLVAWTSTLCRLPSGSVTVTVHQRIDFKASTYGEEKANMTCGSGAARALPGFARLALTLDLRHLSRCLSCRLSFLGRRLPRHCDALFERLQ